MRVLDLTTSVAGPYATLILAALGAEVVKVERPDGGDDTRGWGPPFWNDHSATYLALNAGKRSLAVDLKSSRGLEVIERLVAGSDVFIQNLRPGSAARLGLGFERLGELNPRLLYCSIGAFGKRGPLAAKPGYDPLMQAAGGIMSITGEPDGPPVRAGASIVDQGTGMWAALAILAALRAREGGADGPQLLDLSLYETAINWLPYQVVGYLGSGRLPGPLGSGIEMIAPYEAFPARDGTVMVAAGNDRHFRALCRLLKLDDLPDDARFRTNAARVENRRRLAELLSERLRREDVDTWLEGLEAAGVPAAEVRDLGQMLAAEQTAAIGAIQALPHPEIPDLRLVALPFAVNDDRPEHRTPAPALGAQDRELLRELGYSDEEAADLVADGAVGAAKPAEPSG
ncbi:MAG TPA: CoA transferase [Solirubrobacterales bacterium]|nr:CoA transferase [Solirubrobacterales bacterium]